MFAYKLLDIESWARVKRWKVLYFRTRSGTLFLCVFEIADEVIALFRINDLEQMKITIFAACLLHKYLSIFLPTKTL